MDDRLGLVNTLYDLGHYHLAMSETGRAWQVCHEALSLLDGVEYAGGLINILALQTPDPGLPTPPSAIYHPQHFTNY